MRKGKIFFNPVEGSGTLTISWSSAPKGDAVESEEGLGVGFFSDSGELLCVIFDDVQDFQDEQTLEFPHYFVSILVDKSKVSYSITPKKTKPLTRKKRIKRKQTA